MEREPCKLVPCELCGAEGKLICYCRKATLCENCIGRHLIAEPNLAHKPVTFSQNEVSSLYEREFSQLREHEARLLQEVSDRQDYIKKAKSRLTEEIQKLESFKCTCLEYVTVAVEMSKQKLALAAEAVGRDMAETCDRSKRVLEEAVRALESGEEHWIVDAMEEKGTLWQGHVDLKEITLEETLRGGIEFRLNMCEEAADKPALSKLSRKLSFKSDPKAGKSDSLKPPPTPSKSASKPKSFPQSTTSRRLTSLKIGTESQSARCKKECEFPSPEPLATLSRCLTESPSSTNFGFGSRAAQLQQTAKNVNEISDLVKAFHSPGKSSESFSQLSMRCRAPMPLRELNTSSPYDSPVSKTTRHFRGGKKSENGDEQETFRGSMTALPEVIPEEVCISKPKPCLYYVTPGSTSLVVRDLESSEITVKSFDGIDVFAKQTFWCPAPTGEVFIIGGVVVESQPSTIKRACLIYSPVHDTIETGPSLNTARHSCAALCLKDSLFVTGGIGSELQALKDCERLELKAKKWRRIGNMNLPRESHGMTLHVGRIYVAGTPGEQSIETYNPVNDRWALLHFRVSAGGKACLFSLGEKIAILHDKALTYAWVDKRTAEQVHETEERGWWLSGPPMRCGALVYLQRGAAVYHYSVDTQEVCKSE